MCILSGLIAMLMAITHPSTGFSSHGFGLEEWLNTGKGSIGQFEIGLNISPKSKPITPFLKNGKQLGCISNGNENLFLENDDNGPDGVNTFVFMRLGLSKDCKFEENRELDEFRLFFNLIAKPGQVSELHSKLPSLNVLFSDNTFYTKAISRKFKIPLNVKCSDSNDQKMFVHGDSMQVLDRYFTVCKIERPKRQSEQVVGFIVSLSVTP